MKFFKNLREKINIFIREKFYKPQKCDKCGILIPSGTLHFVGTYGQPGYTKYNYLCDRCYEEYSKEIKSTSKTCKILLILSPIIAFILSLIVVYFIIKIKR